MLCAGIDVSKPHLDLALVSTAAKPTRLRFPSTPEGRRDLLAHLGGPGAHGRLPPPPPPASGREGPPGGPGQPYHLAAFRRATGERHKTDRQDALLLARYAQVCGESLRAYTLPGAQGPGRLPGGPGPEGKGHPQPAGGGPLGGKRGGHPPPEGAGLRGGAPGRGGGQNPGPPGRPPRGRGADGPARGGAPGGGGAGPPAPAPLGKGQGGGLLRGADPRAGGVGEERGAELALPKGASPSAKEAFHGGLGGGAARPGDAGILPSPALAGKAQKAGPGGRGPQAS